MSWQTSDPAAIDPNPLNAGNCLRSFVLPVRALGDHRLIIFNVLNVERESDSICVEKYQRRIPRFASISKPELPDVNIKKQHIGSRFKQHVQRSVGFISRAIRSGQIVCQHATAFPANSESSKLLLSRSSSVAKYTAQNRHPSGTLKVALAPWQKRRLVMWASQALTAASFRFSVCVLPNHISGRDFYFDASLPAASSNRYRPALRLDLFHPCLMAFSQ